MVHDSASRTIYMTRLNRVIVYINNNLSEDLLLDTLAKEAFFSPYHFHRIFTALIGETPNAYVNRVRLESAANMLQRNPGMSITDIAFTTGFSSSAAFSRSFKKHFGCTPSSWKTDHLQWVTRSPERENNMERNRRFREFDHDPSFCASLLKNMTVKRMPAFHVAYVASQKGYHLDAVIAAWNTLCKWAEARDLLTPETGMFGISYDDPDITPYHKCRYYACVTVPEHLSPDDTVGMMEIAAGKYAVFHLEGSVQAIQPAFRVIYAEWLPDSGYQPAHTPCYELYHSTLGEHDQGFYRLDLCLPVEPL